MAAAPITLSANAARRLRDIAATEGRPVMLRVAVEGGGCSGFQYLFDLVETSEADDLRVERDGAAALVDDVSVPFLAGSEIDFVEELAGGGVSRAQPQRQVELRLRGQLLDLSAHPCASPPGT